MKRKFALLLLVFAALGFNSAFAQSGGLKVGYVNSDSVLVSLPEYQSQTKQYESYAKQLQKQIETKEQEFQTKLQSLQQEANDLIPEVLQERQRELQQLQQNLQQFSQQSQVNLGRKEQQLMQPLVVKVQQAIEDVAKEQNFDFIVSQQIFLFAKPEFDLTGTVIEKVNNSGTAASSTEGN